MKISKTKIIVFALIIISLIFAFAGCSLKPEDCYVFDESEFIDLRKEDNSLDTDNALRIMSANVLVHIAGWGGEPVKPRAHRFAEAIKHYAPDIIGVQEMCSEWYKYLLPQIKDDYELIEPKNSLFMENRSPIIYNKNKLNLIKSDLVKYSVGDKNGCRVITYGVFERISDKKTVIVTSTHLDLIRMNDYDKEKEIMLRQVSEFFDVIESLKKDYPKTPIFMTGDYNSMERETSRYVGQDNGEEYKSENDLTYFKCYGKPCGSFAYEKIVEKYIDTKFVDGINRKYDNTRDYLYDDPTWDHIFLTNENSAEILTFRVMTSDYFHNNEDRTSRISDHLPIAVDVILK